ncbi:multidrug transporter EmrE-like cation transporter [Metabacillus sp. SLBN-84]
MNKAWSFVLLGSLFEVGWVIGLKHSSDVLTWTATIAAIVLSFGFLIKATQMSLPVGTAYAVFAGLGTTGTVIAEMAFFDVPFQMAKVLLILVLLIGVVGLKLVTGNSQEQGGVMGWIFLIVAGIFEVIGVTGLNLINKKKSVFSYLVFVVGLACSFMFLSLSMQTLPMGTAYAIWTGIGTVGSGLVGILFYGESKSVLRIVFMAMVLSAAIGLKLIS